MIKELTEKQEIGLLSCGLIGSPYEDMSIDELEIKWVEFSNIQQADFLIVNEEGMRRFVKWMETGNSDDAWS